MNTLLVDIGNTRIKWALLRGERLGRQQAVPLAQFPRFARALARLSKVDAVVAVCVAGRGAEQLLRSALVAANLPSPRFLRSSQRAGGVTNGYHDTWRLGADRWVAAIGAWHAAGGKRAVCAISVGTALTVDVIDERGRHRGGLIAPGPALMRRTLLGETRGIAARAAGARRGPAGTLRGLADNTRDAIQLGSVRACAALIDHCVADLRSQLGARLRVYVSGGGAEAVSPWLRSRVESCPDLVLRGLAVLS